MTVIAEIDSAASGQPVLAAWDAWLALVDTQLRALGAHPARSVVLLPYAQLLPVAARQWAARFPDGFAPRFETTHNWAARVADFAPGPNDVSFDAGRDLLTATSLLEGAGLRDQRAALAGPLVEQTLPLARLAASVPAAMRPDWMALAQGAMPMGGDGPLRLDAALARLAVAWAGTSDYASDVLFSPRVGDALDALLIAPGLQPDPLVLSLADHYFEKAVHLPWPDAPAPGQVALHACLDAEDEAERAAACVLRHLHAGRAPVGLVAGDRVLTRRISALLATRGARLRDETGWKLSTTHAAAGVLALLAACAPRATTDTVLDWLKLSPAFAGAELAALERRLRRDAVRDWPRAAALMGDDDFAAAIEAVRASLQGARALSAWQDSLQGALRACGLWAALAQDAAGQAVLGALGYAGDLADVAHPHAERRLRLPEWTQWVRATLEAASFKPPAAPAADVVVLPLGQLLGRPLAALVLPGADEQRLPAAPEPPGPWSAAQREMLRLPSRDELRHAQQAAWQLALAVPHVDVLWRQGDDSGETLLPSPLVQALQLQELPTTVTQGQEPRLPHQVAATPVARPAPSGAALPVTPLSASGYEQLRTCPYRFFALRQLGLAEEGELDVDVDKRDFGTWVHAVLSAFHTALHAAPDADRVALMDQAASDAARRLSLDEGEFLPFSVAWPALRDGYLQWLAGHEAAGARFEAAELTHELALGEVQLQGRLDRLDRQPDGSPLVIDYKTESATRTQSRIQAGTEDTQLAFYALLTGHDTPRALYLNVGEREPAKPYESKDITALAALLADGIQHDLARVAAGAPLPALGEGSACDWCAARGLCRKGAW
ncbi:MAG: PD-(D/E)XK nuclease family protein [Pseudomonadota bacterium]|nr:PD-(D/E)XK nuclease family protein [Pseudomonadota bacterium]